MAAEILLFSRKEDESNNRLNCKDFPKYITKPEHMKPEYQYYKEVNSKDGAYYRRWESSFGPYMSTNLLPFQEKVSRLVDAEWELRYTKKLNRFIKKATLKYPTADLDDTIYDPERQLNSRAIEELAKCEWISQGRNLMVTGQTGSGKSYLANALCISALRQFKMVKYIRASHLIDELNRSEAHGTYRE